MHKYILSLGILAILMSGITGIAAAAPAISFDPATVALSPGSAAQVKVVLSEAPHGLAGYKLTVRYPSGTVTVTGATFPSWGSSMNLKNPVSGGYLISAVDPNKQVQNGSINVILGTITLKAVSDGSATVTISDIQMNDDTDAVITPSTGVLQATVEGNAVTATATTTPAPTATTTTTTTTITTTTTSKTATTTAVTATSTTIPVTPGTTTAAVTSTTIVPAVTVTVPPPPVVTPEIAGFPTCVFTVNKAAGYAPLEVRFRDLSPGESLSGWEWDFGDGGSTMTQNPTYIYSTPGTYTVSLTVTNNLGSTTSTRAGLIRVLGPGEVIQTVAQVTPQQTTAGVSTEPVHTLPVWTSPEKTSTAPANKAAFPLPLALAGIGVAAAGCLFLKKKGS